MRAPGSYRTRSTAVLQSPGGRTTSRRTKRKAESSLLGRLSHVFTYAKYVEELCSLFDFIIILRKICVATIVAWVKREATAVGSSRTRAIANLPPEREVSLQPSSVRSGLICPFLCEYRPLTIETNRPSF